MDPNLLKNLGLDSSLTQNDIQLINQICSSMGPGGNNKPPKMSAKDRNNLMAKLSSNNTLKQIPQKELKDMNEEEKKIYREELKQKLKNKQNELKMRRTSNVSKQQILNNTNNTNNTNNLNNTNNTNNTNYNQAIGNLSEMMKNISPESLESLNLNQIDSQVQTEKNLTQPINTKQEIIINNIINQTTINDEKLNNQIDNLDDYIN
jgi:hypothetical protein